MPINYSTLVKSEKDLHEMFCNYFKHINDMQAYLLKQVSSHNSLSDSAFKTIKESEEKSNNFEALILDETGWILSKDNPRAAHLRYIIAVMRSIKDLERMGDFAYSVALFFRNEKKLDKNIKAILLDMMKKSSDISNEICKHIASQTKNTKDYYVSIATPLINKFGEFYRKAFKELGKKVFKNKNTETQFKAFSIIRHLERNVDHAFNILESFIYIKEPDFYFKKPEK